MEIWLILGLGQETNKMSLEHHVMSGSKKMLKTKQSKAKPKTHNDRSPSKRLGVSTRRFSGQSWSNLSKRSKTVLGYNPNIK